MKQQTNQNIERDNTRKKEIYTGAEARTHEPIRLIKRKKIQESEVVTGVVDAKLWVLVDGRIRCS